MKLSARNALKGKVVAIATGLTTTVVKLEIADGMVISSSITNEAVQDLGLVVGSAALAVIKSSDVILAVE